ncbi:hypothetical protein BU26DRAFT_577460 [Trematosphaeria pertusa]|uniref:Uncharacterized protein n=1 Tax=Trematosphaeria pertusa TaxID=390896 RepID=A0A6A6I7L8_9PLEO|nr:uncharacterized protein BU26DRAFT_577460 [Trematosphaeria pertusa]KAF2245952.1 hypothetical protein BU26DRAFT_577460 [Trematosphaeria pertusa]
MGDASQDSKLQKKDKGQGLFRTIKNMKITSSHGRKEMQPAGPHELQRQPVSPKANGSARRPSFSMTRQPTDQHPLPSEIELEKARQEGRVLERGLSQEKVNGIYSDPRPPTPPPHDVPKPGAGATVRQPASAAQNASKLSSMVDMGMAAPSQLPAGAQPLRPVAASQPVYSVATQEMNTHSLEEQLEKAHAYQKSLESERDDEKRRADTFSVWYEQMKTQKENQEKERRRLDNELSSAKRRLAEIEPQAAAAKSMQENHQRALGDRDLRIQRLQAEVEGLRSAHDRAVGNATQLHDQNLELQQDLRRGKETFNAVSKELRQLRSDLKSNLDDKYFIEQWNDLHSKIQNLTNQYFVGRLSRSTGSVLTRAKGSRVDKLDIQPSKRLMFLTREHAQYIGSETHRPLIIQAFIWWILNNKVFDHANRCSEGLYWAGDMRQTLASLKAELRPVRKKDSPRDDPDAKRVEAEARIFHKWRATTGSWSMILWTSSTTS